MEQVLTNLVTNAIKYASGAPVSIESSANGGFYQLAFQDSGPGVPESDRQRIFERFERLASGSHVSGFGLGLYIVRQIAQGHGGKIYVAANPVPGARFVIEFPRST